LRQRYQRVGVDYKLRYNQEVLNAKQKICILLLTLSSCTISNTPAQNSFSLVEIINNSETPECIFLTSILNSSTGFSPSDATKQALNELKRQASVIEGNAILITGLSSSYDYEYEYKRDLARVQVDVYYCKNITK
jgi:DeoR/GlpR family transcriptional regulator of sugar metabolism